MSLVSSAALAGVITLLAELSCDRTRKIQFREKSLSAFWLSVSAEYPLLSNKVVNILLPFATTYLCETAFSALTNMKTKYRSRLVVESDMRVCLSNITPRIDSLRRAKQAHPLHYVGLFVKSSVLKNFSILQ